MTTTDDTWERIEVHLLAAGVAATAGASEVAITVAEARIGATFPEALRRSLLRHDGLGHDSRTLLYGTAPCSVATLVARWDDMSTWQEDGSFDEEAGRTSR